MSASATSVIMPSPTPAVRATFAAPMFPLPATRGSTPARRASNTPERHRAAEVGDDDEEQLHAALETEPTPLATVAPPLQQAVGEETDRRAHAEQPRHRRSEEHTSELQSRLHLVCRLLLEKK